MASVEEAIEVEAPVNQVYEQWTRFEEFPRFMEGVRDVRPIGDLALHWVVEVAGHRVEWDTVIDRQEKNRRVGWRSAMGANNAAEARFRPMSGGRTQVTLRAEFPSEGLGDAVATASAAVSERLTRDLRRFKSFMETRLACERAAELDEDAGGDHAMHEGHGAARAPLA